MRLTRLGLVIGLVLLSAVSAASAQGSLDLVELSNGGFVRGTVLVYEPGQPVVVQFPDGTTRTLQPNDIARVRMGGAEAPSPAPSAPSPAPSAPSPAPSAPSPASAPPSAPAAAPARSAPSSSTSTAPAMNREDRARRLVPPPVLVGGRWVLDDRETGRPWPPIDVSPWRWRLVR